MDSDTSTIMLPTGLAGRLLLPPPPPMTRASSSGSITEGTPVCSAVGGLGCCETFIGRYDEAIEGAAEPMLAMLDRLVVLLGWARTELERETAVVGGAASGSVAERYDDGRALVVVSGALSGGGRPSVAEGESEREAEPELVVEVVRERGIGADQPAPERPGLACEALVEREPGVTPKPPRPALVGTKGKEQASATATAAADETTVRRDSPRNPVANHLSADGPPALAGLAEALAEAAFGHERRRAGDIVLGDSALE